MHLVIDGYGAPAELLNDEGYLYTFLDDYPASIGMTKITAPRVFSYVGANAEDWGASGFVIIAESHISVHTFPDRNYLNIDVFSCKEFDADRALGYLQEYFSLDTARAWILDRGLEHLDPPTATEVVKAQRQELTRGRRA